MDCQPPKNKIMTQRSGHDFGRRGKEVSAVFARGQSPAAETEPNGLCFDFKGPHETKFRGERRSKGANEVLAGRRSLEAET